MQVPSNMEQLKTSLERLIRQIVREEIDLLRKAEQGGHAIPPVTTTLPPLNTTGSSRFDKFSEHARRVLTISQEEAQRFNHNYIGTEHILLGLVRETEGAAARVISSLGVDLTKVRSAVEFIIGRGEKPAQGEIGLTPRAKKVVELAVDEARRMNHTYIGTEHLLIGLLREGEGVAAGVLESLGITLDKARGEVSKLVRA